MFAAALETFGRVDAVLNVAGIGSFEMLADLPLDEYDRVFGVNLKGVLLGTKHGIRAMLPTGGGSIVNWSSIGGLGASPGTSAYSASKAGVISFTKSAAIEYGTAGHPRQRRLPRLRRDLADRRPGLGRPVPAAPRGVRAQARRPARGGRRAGVVPGVGPRQLHHRRHHPDRRRHHGPGRLTPATDETLDRSTTTGRRRSTRRRRCSPTSATAPRCSAGGQSLVPMLALRLAYLDHLVDIGRIAELQRHRAS